MLKINRLFKKLFLKYKLSVLLKYSQSLGRKNKKSLVLIDEERVDVSQLIKAFNEVFAGELKPVFLIFSKTKQKSPEANFMYISPSNFLFSKSNLSQNLIDITNQKFEFVFQFFPKKNIYLKYISATAKANLRIGTYNSFDKITDLKISEDDLDWEGFFKESKKYIYNINK